jgi:hypothetical protein
MKSLIQLLLVSFLLLSKSSAMEHKFGVLTLINQTGATLELYTEEHQRRPEGGWEVIKSKTPLLIEKGKSFNLPLDKTEKASLSYRTTYLGKKIVELPLKEIRRETQGNNAMLIIRAGGITGSDIVIDLEKNLKISKSAEELAPEAEKVKEENRLQEVTVRNDALMNIFVRHKDIYETKPQEYKGQQVLTPPIESTSSTVVKENQHIKIPLVTKKSDISTLTVKNIDAAPAYETDEANVLADREKLTGWVELPLERIKRMAGSHTEAIVPITRESGALGKTLKLNLHDIEFR